MEKEQEEKEEEEDEEGKAKLLFFWNFQGKQTPNKSLGYPAPLKKKFHGKYAI